MRTPAGCSDILFIFLHHAQSIPLTIYLDAGIGKQRGILNVSELVDYCTTILGLYVFKGEDVTIPSREMGRFSRAILYGHLKHLLRHLTIRHYFIDSHSK